jgi:hypothetical protein
MDTYFRRVILRPYRKGMGPSFRLDLLDHRTVPSTGRERISYRFTMHEGGATTVLFQGADFQVSPYTAVDSDDAVRSLLTFLTLRKGDTDSEYFADYTADQVAFRDTHAEAVGMAVYDRFGEG